MDQDLAVGDLVSGMSGDDLCGRRLAGAVRPHQGVDLARFDLEVDTLENLLVALSHFRVQVA